VVKRNAAGLARSLKAMADRLGPEHEALVAAARGLAEAVDTDPANASLWREYRAAIADLIEAGGTGGPSDEAAAFLGIIRTPAMPAPVGHPTHN